MATTTATPDVSLSEQNETARQIVLSLATNGGVACVSKLKDACDLNSTNTARYHLNNFEKEPTQFVERTGETVDVGAPKESIEYRLTDAGRTAVSNYTETDTGLPLEEEVEYLRMEVDSLREEVQQAEQRADEAHDRIDSINEYIQSR